MKTNRYCKHLSWNLDVALEYIEKSNFHDTALDENILKIIVDAILSRTTTLLRELQQVAFNITEIIHYYLNYLLLDITGVVLVKLRPKCKFVEGRAIDVQN